MQTTMTSRERALAAINHEEPDRVPVFFRGVAPFDANALRRGYEERVDFLLEKGVDAKVTLAASPQAHPDVSVRDWFDDDSDPDYRLACREWHTPAGTMRAVMRRTPDCDYADGIPLCSDHNVSRGVEFPVKGRDDLPKLDWLLREPDAESIAAFRERARAAKRFAAQRAVLVEGSGGVGGDLGLYVCGSDLFYLVQDDPEFGQELVEMSYQIDLKCIEIVLDEGVDIIDARGCYETAPLWSPRFFDELFAHRIARKAALAHQGGAKFSYFSSGNLVPHLDALLAADVDIVNCVRPFPGGVNDMRLLKRRVGRRICLWGGVNPEEDIERATTAHIRRAVIDVILAAAAGGGFVLSPGGSLYDPDRYDNVMTFIEAALEFGRYPIDTTRLEAEFARIGDGGE